MHTELSRDQLHVTVDLLILTIREGRLNLLLSRRVAPPYEGCWALPGRFIGLTESAETAAGKLLAEMLPVRDVFLEQLYTFTEVSRDPRGRVISTAYLVTVPWSRLEAVLAAGETSFRSFAVTLEGEALRLDDGAGTVLAGSDLAFDHGRIAATGVLRLRNKIDYTDIGFTLLENPRAFSLGELQGIFEAVTDTPLDASNFRRGILTRYEKTGRIRQTSLTGQGGRGRPAVLYRLAEAHTN